MNNIQAYVAAIAISAFCTVSNSARAELVQYDANAEQRFWGAMEVILQTNPTRADSFVLTVLRGLSSENKRKIVDGGITYCNARLSGTSRREINQKYSQVVATAKTKDERENLITLLVTQSMAARAAFCPQISD
ncbi:MAG: hypothetical protein J0L70_28745 [Leptolyngbya sp. UWPOB_LEPTO1]|uniref:hypothetical protein n=1 Tax=Leptolyngbya sp. UWPOB_LEPTO1 TaxID=2815653 RepID=UPI001ACEC59B|nr:hypothetical protein [Leptolyngbya sp. UWPOB_LEPTO1]MBN8564525.1 hypothetical protein [Leptolyngbya sp. UWPOB_LEPTO1]